MPLPGEDEPLHAWITATTEEIMQGTRKRILEIIQQGIDVPDAENDLRKQQLRELALINGTLKENDGLAKLRQSLRDRSVCEILFELDFCRFRDNVRSGSHQRTFGVCVCAFKIPGA